MRKMEELIELAERKRKEARERKERWFYDGIAIGLMNGQRYPAEIEAEIEKAGKRYSEVEGKDAEMAMFFSGMIHGLLEAKQVLGG